MTHRIAIYPGSFDPITFGHLDIVRRALKITDQLIIALAKDNNKKPLFSLEKRMEMIKKEVEILNQECGEEKILVVDFVGLLVDFAVKNKANIIIRGLRAVSDFEYEFQMAGMNSRLNHEIQTIFLPTSESTHFVASRLVKEVARLGGSVSDFVSPNVAYELEKIFKNAR